MFFALLLADGVALFLADVIAIALMWQMLQPPGRCCACITVGRCFVPTLFVLVADVIAICFCV